MNKKLFLKKFRLKYLFRFKNKKSNFFKKSLSEYFFSLFFKVLCARRYL